MPDEQIAEIASTLSPAECEDVVMRYWRRGNLTPLGVANSLARRRSAIAFDQQRGPARQTAR
jgi:hypothetical protein